MNDIIKPHTFEDAKQHIQEFSKESASDVRLSPVENAGGLFGWFDHNVTGTELNALARQIQEHLFRFNDLDNKFIQEFGQVYKALESLDEEYIPAIIRAVKGAENASNKANSTLKIQEKIIQVLEDHKKRLDQLKYLEKIDELWDKTQDIQISLNACIEDFGNVNTAIQKLVKEHEEEKKEYQSIISKMRNKFKLAYILAGGALGIAITGLMINIIGIL